jgi:nucleotide-binding universal stress UspA family protein
MTDKNVIIVITDIQILREVLPSIIEWMDKLTGDVKTILLHVKTDIKTNIINETQLKELMKEFAQHGIRTKLKQRTGSLSKEIIREAREIGAFAILMSSDSRAGLSKALATTLIEELIRYAPCPVVVFKPKLLKFSEKI